MDFWSRLIGGTHAPKKPPTKATLHDPQARLARFRRVYYDVRELGNRLLNNPNDASALAQLPAALNRLVALIREETRAPVPHLCLQYAAQSQIYSVVGRAAGRVRSEAVIHAAVHFYAALVDSEEEEFLAVAAFARSLMRLVTQVIDGGKILLGAETETAILEVLFTISAKIRLQPEILPVWFQSTAKPDAEDVFVREKRSFVGITQKDDFPLCYLLIDRVHHDGRIGDFARTGLLYIFEATGRSPELEEWVVSSDLSTLMASGLGALYSQLSRELSILHPDATLPAVLAMSDYSTTQSRLVAESAFSDKHKIHMATFLSYLAFWQDVLDHCRSADVKQTLLDHFQILFLQQLLYPSLLQSSDTDAGSSVAVLTYVTAILEALEYPDLLHTMLSYLLAFQEDRSAGLALPSAPTTPARPSMPPRSPTAVKRRQSLMLLTAAKDPSNVVEPNIFNLVDLVLNSVGSSNNQTAFAALKLLTTMMVRQKHFALGPLLKVQSSATSTSLRPVGALEVEQTKYMDLAVSLGGTSGLDAAYRGLTEDLRYALEAQVPLNTPTLDQPMADDKRVGIYILPTEDPLLQTLTARLRTFLTNSVDVNLALTQAIVAIATTVELRLDGWLALCQSSYTFAEDTPGPPKPWRAYVDTEEAVAWTALQQALRPPLWSDAVAPSLYSTLQAVAQELDAVRIAVPNMKPLLVSRQSMLRAAVVEGPLSEPPSLVSSPTHSSPSETALLSREHHHPDRNPSSSLSSHHARNKATNKAGSPLSATHTAPKTPPPRSQAAGIDASTPARPIFQPPPPETPSTTDVLMRKITFPSIDAGSDDHVTSDEDAVERRASLNHVLTNIVILQDFVLELAAVLQVRGAVLGGREVRFA